MAQVTQQQIDKLLDITSGHHGFWLINNVEHIGSDLEFLLTWHRGNVQNARVHLNDLESDFTKKLYAKIETARSGVELSESAEVA